MANIEILCNQQRFVEEIEYNDIEQLEIVGKGSFGTVYKAKWRGMFVAVKHIDSEAERKTFSTEIRQMSRVSHPNIVQLYGACTKNRVCLVMEYAEGGSLYNVLHNKPELKYNAGHAISWSLQCAKGVEYLHNMKPKALIHRDLKPPNLLLEMGGKVLKICDFGTACDLKTYMTNNKGSAAWMAPEVFEGCNYTEKCDVYSWGTILWQVLTRKKPFHDIGGPALRIMWSVHKGERPPLIEGCPKPIENLLIRCWAKNADSRPSMSEIVQVMSILFTFFSGYDEPIEYSTEDSLDSDCEEEKSDDSCCDILDSYIVHSQLTNDNENDNKMAGARNKIDSRYATPLSINVDDVDNGQSNPFGCYTSDDILKPIDESLFNPTQSQSDINGISHTIYQPEENLDNTSNEELDKIYLMLDPQLRPVEPDRSSEESVKIFEQHKQLATEYFKVQTEITYMSNHMKDLSEKLSELDTDEQDKEVHRLQEEKRSLLELYKRLKIQLEILESKNQRTEQSHLT